MSEKFNMVYSAGNDGSLFVWSYGEIDQEQLDAEPSPLHSYFEEVFGKDPAFDEDIPNYKVILEQEEDAMQLEYREKIR